MKVKKKLVLLVILCFILTGCSGGDNSNQENESIIRNDGLSELKTAQTVEGIEFSNLKLVVEGDSTLITMSIKNTTTEAVNLAFIGYEFFDSEDTFVWSTQVAGKELTAGENWSYSNKAPFDITNAVYVRYEAFLESFTEEAVPIE